MYRTREFALLAGVTVRTLHHYDRLGLLCPKRTAAGYRLYQEHDLERLEQIVALRFAGLGLRQIRELLAAGPLHWREALRLQRRALEARRRQIDLAIRAISDAEDAVRPDVALLKRILEVMEMEYEQEWLMGHFIEDARDMVELRRQHWTPELQIKAEQDWAGLFQDVEAVLGEDVASERAQALAARWMALVEAFTGADREVRAGVAAVHRDQANWPEGFREQMSPFRNRAVWEWMGRALAVRNGKPV